MRCQPQQTKTILYQFEVVCFEGSHIFAVIRFSSGDNTHPKFITTWAANAPLFQLQFQCISTLHWQLLNTKNKSNNAILRLKCESYQLWMFSHFYRAEPGLKLFLWKSAESVERWNLGKECLKTEMSSEKECDATIHWTVSHTQSFKSAGKYQKCGWATTASKRDLQDLMFEQRERPP